MEQAVDRKTMFRLGAVFALIYFFSPNGLASLPGISVSFLLKDVLHMTASQAAYFSAITIIGWALKPLWGIISDAFPILGYRRKSYLIVTTLLAALIWLMLGRIEQYNMRTLVTLFTLSSVAYAFMDVICDALMVETGRPGNLTGRFQSIQWTAVYIAAGFTGFAGGWVAEHLRPQTVFSVSAAFPLVILAAVFLFIREERASLAREQFRRSMGAIKEGFRHPTLWLLAFFLFFWTFSPSFGAPFFYYAVDTLQFDKMFFGILASVGALSAAVGAILYGKFYARFRTRTLIKIAIIVGTVATLFDLVYFTPFVVEHLDLARMIRLVSAALLGVVGSITFLTMLNAAALAAPRFGEGTTFATLTAFWNVGLIGSDALGGYLFGVIGLPLLIIVSTFFTAATWAILIFMKFEDEQRPKVILDKLE